MIEPGVFLPEDRFIWFDLDDTLWDFHHNSREALTDVFDKYGLNRFCPCPQEWSETYHAVNDPLWDLLAQGKITSDELRHKRFSVSFANIGMPEEEIGRIGSEADTYYLSQLSIRKTLVPGVLDLLSRLKERGYKIGVLSNGFREFQTRKLISGGIDRFVDILVTSDEIGINKPDSRIFDYALDKAGVAASRSIMI